MADWHVYLLTLDVSVAPARFERGQKVEATFMVTDDDTGDPVEGGTVRVRVRGSRRSRVPPTTRGR